MRKFCTRRRGASMAAAVLSVAVIGLASACSSSSSSNSAVGGSQQTVHMAVYPGSLLNLPLWVMQQEGFCKAHGLDCVPTNISSGPLGLQLLTAGSLQFFYGSTDVTLEGVANGLAVKIVSGIRPNNFYTLERSKNSTIKAGDYASVVQQLAGKAIGVNALGSGAQLEVQALFSSAGLSADSAKYVAVGGPSTQFTALANNQVAAALVSSPIQAVCQIEKACSPLVDLEQGQGPATLTSLNGGFTTVVAASSYISSHPQVVAAFVAALNDAIKWLQNPANLNAATALAASNVQFQGLPNASSVIKQSVVNGAKYFSTSVSRSAVDAFSKYLVSKKLISQNVSSSQVVDPSAPR